MSTSRGRVGLVQRVLPEYRVPFFDALAEAFPEGLSVFSGKPRPGEAIVEGNLKIASHSQANNYHCLKGPFYFYWQGGLSTWLKAWQPEVLIHAADPRCISLPAATNWMHRGGRFIIGWGLGTKVGRGWKGVLHRSSSLALIRKFDALITYSRKGAEEYGAAGFDPLKIFIAPNAVAPRPSGNPAERPPIFNNGTGTILFVGRLQARKRVDTLLRACALLPETIRPELLIAGEGPERTSLQKLADEVYPQAQFLGAKFGKDLEGLFIKADLLVLPGTGGLAVQQGMSFGLPVLVGEADGTQVDMVRPENGWLVSGDDDRSLAEDLETALSSPARLRSMGKESWRIVSEEINLENMVKVFQEAVSSVLEG